MRCLRRKSRSLCFVVFRSVWIAGVAKPCLKYGGVLKYDINNNYCI